MAVVHFEGGATSATTNVSGQIVLISGQHVFIESGAHVVTSVSGNVVSLSGETVNIRWIEQFSLVNITGVVTLISGQTVLTQSASGETLRMSGLGVLISGQCVCITSGTTVLSQAASGETLRNSGLVVITTSGQGFYTPTIVKTAGVIRVTANSGGVAIHSGIIVAAAIKAPSGNTSDIYVGGSGNMPFSGFGYILEPGDAVTMDINDFNNIRACAVVSGERVSFMGVQ